MEEASGSGSADASYSIQAPGPIYRDKRFIITKFSQAYPDFHDAAMKWRFSPEKPETITGGKKLPPKDGRTPLLLLSGKHGAEPLQRGVPEGGLRQSLTAAPASSSARQAAPTAAKPTLGSNYFVFVKVGKTITAYPIEALYNFRPPNRRAALSLEEAEAMISQNKARQSAIPGGRFVPKSVRQKEAEAEAEGRGKGIEDQLFGSDDDDVGVVAPKRRGGGGGGRGGPKKSAPYDIDADEMPEDIYQGEGDDLRPEKPEPAEDWEHAEEHADDDEYMGDGEDTLEDDPGERKKLGLEGQDEEEELNLDEDEKKLRQKLDEADEGEEEEEEEDYEGGAGGVGQYADADLDEDLDLDEMANDVLPVPSRNKRGSTPEPGKGAAGAAAAKRKPEDDLGAAGGAKKARLPTPPPQTGPPARAATPPVRGSSVPPKVPTSPVKAGGVASAQRARTATPPVGAKRSTPPPSGKGPTPTPSPSGMVKSAGSVKQEEVVKMLKESGRIPLMKLRTAFQDRLKTTEARDQFKKMVIQVGKLEKDPDGTQVVVLKPNV